jgi:hypothetical protein
MNHAAPWLILLCLLVGIGLYGNLPEMLIYRDLNSTPNMAASEHSETFANLWIARIELIAREEHYPPTGIQPQRDRPIGFASVFVYLENPGFETVTVTLEEISIRTVDDRMQPFTFTPTDIQLRPLEHSELVFHLTNTTGYDGDDPVRAIATYRVGDRSYHCLSEPVAIQR